MKKRSISTATTFAIILLCATLVLGILLANASHGVAFAADTESDVCSHPDVDANNKCTSCNAQMVAKITSGETVTFYGDYATAVSALANGDMITLLADVSIKDSNVSEINVNVTYDINGKSVSGYYLRFTAGATIANSSTEGGRIIISVPGSTPNVIIDETNVATSLKISRATDNVKIYAGNIEEVENYNSLTIPSLLPAGHTLVQVTDSGEHTMTWQEIQATTASKVENLKVIECKHESFDDNGTCLYCNSSVGEAINQAKTKVDNAKAALTEAIDKKADTATLNQKIADLETAISDAQAASRSFAIVADKTLENDLNETIVAAKNEAITAADTALSNAISELNNSISEKANATDVNEKIATLESSIATAQQISQNFATGADEAVKSELNANIASAKNEAISTANDALSDAVNTLNQAISEKASATDVKEKVAALESSIATAQQISLAFATDADETLKNELNANIASAKAEALAKANEALDAAAQLSEKLDALEKDSAETKKDFETLQTAFIVCIVLLFLSVIALTVVSVFCNRRKNAR